MMNNPALYLPQNPYGYGMVQGHVMPTAAQSFNPSGFPDQFQGPFQSHQPQQQPQSSFPGSHPGIQNPPNQTAAQNHPRPQPQHIPRPTPQQPPSSSRTTENKTPSSATSTPPNNAMAQAQSTPNNLAQQAQMQNAAQMSRAVPQPTPSLSPQSQARERARVSVLLDINTALLKEVISLQSQGKAGVAPTQGQQSPTSPTSADPNSALSNSPVDAAKQGQKPASQEYADCMRRLQANLSYLATIADAKKKVNGTIPVGPAIMIPPPHLTEVHDLYKKLNQLFPEASQSTINKAMAFASAQATNSKPNSNSPQG